MDFVVELNRDLIFIQRTGYTLLELLSDVGGVQSILMTMIAYIVGLCNYKHFDTYMASQLFKISKHSPDKKSSGEQEHFTPDRFSNLKHLIMDKFCTFCRKRGICRKSSRLRLIAKTRKRLEKEVNIIDIVKWQRYFHMALRHLLL